MPPKRSDEGLQEHWAWMDEHSYPDLTPAERDWLRDYVHGADEAVPGIVAAHDECDREAA
jgi:hypothetical protein